MEDYLELYTGYNFDNDTALCNKLNDITKNILYIFVQYIIKMIIHMAHHYLKLNLKIK